MALTGDRSIGYYAGHSIELVRNNWNKTITLLIDGEEVAQESRVLPHSITLTGTIVHAQVTHTVVATAKVHLLTATDSVEVDGHAIPLTKTN